jgi:hypothetical protein
LLGSAAQNKEGEGRREQASVARASRPPGRKGKEGKFTHFIFFSIFNTIFKNGF